jgi:hypothetical protein
MATSIILTKLDDDADAIVKAFAEETGLSAEDRGDTWVFDIDGEEHEIDVVQTLTAIDEDWTEHVGFQDPA